MCVVKRYILVIYIYIYTHTNVWEIGVVSFFKYRKNLQVPQDRLPLPLYKSVHLTPNV